MRWDFSELPFDHPSDKMPKLDYLESLTAVEIPTIEVIKI